MNKFCKSLALALTLASTLGTSKNSYAFYPISRGEIYGLIALISLPFAIPEYKRALEGSNYGIWLAGLCCLSLPALHVGKMALISLAKPESRPLCNKRASNFIKKAKFALCCFATIAAGGVMGALHRFYALNMTWSAP